MSRAILIIFRAGDSAEAASLQYELAIARPPRPLMPSFGRGAGVRPSLGVGEDP